MSNDIQQMATLRRLFFYYEDLLSEGKSEKARDIQKKQDSLLKELKGKGYDVAKLVEDLIEECKIQKLMNTPFQHLLIFTDGGISNNHDQEKLSHAASAFVVYGDNKLITHKSFYIGNSTDADFTSTFAEYHGLYQALSFVSQYEVSAKQTLFLTDCLSIVRHIHKKRLPNDSPYRNKAKKANRRLKELKATIKHIPREKNKMADKLVNQVLYLYERSGTNGINQRRSTSFN